MMIHFSAYQVSTNFMKKDKTACANALINLHLFTVNSSVQLIAIIMLF